MSSDRRLVTRKEINEFLLINYPAIVKSKENALNTFGGIDKLFNALNNKQSLELRFRCEDFFSRTISSNSQDSLGLLLKVRIRKRKKSDLDNTALSLDVLGYFKKCFNFHGMSDYQYSPIITGHQNQSRSDSVGGDVDVRKWFQSQSLFDQNFFNSSVCCYLPPGVFTRLDRPHYYCYGLSSMSPAHSSSLKAKPHIHTELNASTENDVDDLSMREDTNLLSRMSSGLGLQSIYQSDVSVPQKPTVQLLSVLQQSKSFMSRQVAQVRKLFDERPIMSRECIYHKLAIDFRKSEDGCDTNGDSQPSGEESTNITDFFLAYPDLNRIVLPAVCYTFHNGPWRRMCVRHGYDPRQQSDSWMFQIVDYRDKLCAKKSSKRSILDRVSRINSLNTHQSDDSSIMDLQDGNLFQDYIFKPDVIPTSRQTLFQICDIEIDEVQTLCKSNLSSTYSADFGWLQETVFDKIRSIISSHITNCLSRNNSNSSEIDSSNQVF